MMRGSLLWGLAAVCNFVSAAITYNDNGRVLIVAMQVFAGLLMILAALKFSRRH
ncbi:MAG TPA: hypothetical protein VM911_22700 [Pyrinomonadaceae bacterium]|jgi:hypothetical protein|nr:hypothetical protein [Pyrinomonadaceae bacterium]